RHRLDDAHPACRRRHLPPGQGRGHARSPHACRIWRALGRGRRQDQPHPRRGRPHRLGRHHLPASRRECRCRGWQRAALLRRDPAFHHTRLSLQDRAAAAHQFPSAALDPVHAGRFLRRSRAHEACLCPCHRHRLSLLFLWRCDPAVAGGGMSGFRFELLSKAGAARRGRMHTAHGTIETPAFMPVGTAGTVKGMTPEAVLETGAEVVLANTYHLMLRPGAERVAALGGLHRFMHCDKPILTDSGGYQVMSLASLRKIDEEGVTFRSHIDGSAHRLTPERSTEIQHLLDATISMAFDECTPFPASEEETARSMDLSMRWAERSRRAFRARPGYAQFGIVQGGVFPGLRRRSVESLLPIGFEGFAIGGLAVGEGQATMLEVIEATAPLLPQDRPRYLM